VLALLVSLAPGLRAAPVTSLAYSPDGAALVSNGTRTLDVRSATDGAVKRRIPCDLARITTLAFHPRGGLLAVGGGSPGLRGELAIVDWKQERILLRQTNHTDLVNAVAFDATGSLLAVASADQAARLWRVAENGTALVETAALTGHTGPVLAIAFSPDGQSVVTASADRSLKVWSVRDGRLLRSLNYHTEPVHTVVFRPRPSDAAGGPSATCASAGDDRTVRVWQPGIGRMVRIIRRHDGPIFALAYSPDGATLYSAGREGVVRRLDAESDAVLEAWPAQPDWIYALAVSPDGRRLATGDWTGAVRVQGATGSASRNSTNSN
jgi:WD40 repeat protein